MNARVNVLWAALLVAGGYATHLQAQSGSPLEPYYGNTLLCQNQSSKAVCHLWLNPDRSYFLMVDRGAQPDVPVAGGNFRLEGRRGSYRLRGKPGAYTVCLQPDRVPGKTFAIEREAELYGGKGCYPLPERALGESWLQDVSGRQYKMWLVKGHG